MAQSVKPQKAIGIMAKHKEKRALKRAGGAVTDREIQSRLKTKFKPSVAHTPASGSVDPDFAHRDAQLLADWMATMTRKHCTKLTDIELRELDVPRDSIVDISSLNFAGERTIDRLPEFLDKALDYLTPSTAGRTEHVEKPPTEKGSPHTLVISPSALRSTDVIRGLRAYVKPGVPIVKLFAKHFSLKDHAKFVQSTKMHFGAGTPDRIDKLIELGVLKTDRLKAIVIDGSWLNGKKQNIMDIRETAVALVTLLKEVRRLQGEGQNCRVLFF